MINISLSGRKRCFDNILVERLWRVVRYEEVYISSYEEGWDAENGLARLLWRYCHVVPHCLLGVKTPDMVYSKKIAFPSRSELTITEPVLVQ